MGASSKFCIVGQSKWTFKEEKNKKKIKLIVLSCTQDIQMSANKIQKEKKKKLKVPKENTKSINLEFSKKAR